MVQLVEQDLEDNIMEVMVALKESRAQMEHMAEAEVEAEELQ